MYHRIMTDDLARFVASLRIPADRKTIVLAELTDHVACAIEAATRDGSDPDAAARGALGNLDALRRSLEAVEPAFRITRAHAIARGAVAGVLVAIFIDQTGSFVHAAVGALAAVAIAAVFAPPRALDLLRAELRASRVRGALGVGRGVPIGPALAYAFTVMSAPILVWIPLIVVRACGGKLDVDVPLSAFAVITAVYLVLLVEAVRARREATTA